MAYGHKTTTSEKPCKAAVQVNRTMLEFYWIMRQNLVEKKPEPAYRTGGIKQLSVVAAKPNNYSYGWRRICIQ